DSLEWIANIDSCSFNITEFDATLNRMNISISATLYDYAELTAEPQKTGAYTTKALSLEAKNISFNPANIITDPAGTDDPAERRRRLREIIEAAAKLE
ncbi:MAG: hypothetical protein KBT04_00340, partial [Bacteroidales bacterium]|nr:hypothetical protein [Candidatus Colimorpha onthohippi]